MNVLPVLCNLIQKYMNLPDGRVFIFNPQLIAKAPDLFVTVQTLGGKPFSSNPTQRWDGAQYWEDITMSNSEMIQIDVCSRTTETINRYLEVVSCLSAWDTNEESQRVGMKIQLLPNMKVISDQDGEAIPYRYVLTVIVTSSEVQSRPMPWYDHGFIPPSVTVQL